MYAIRSYYEFTDVLEVSLHPLLVRRSELPLQLCYPVGDPIQNATIGRTAHRTFLGGTSRTKQLLECNTRVTDDRQGFRRGGPTDGIGVHTGISIGTTAGLIDVFDAQLSYNFV